MSRKIGKPKVDLSEDSFMPEVIDLDTILKSDRFKLFREQNKDWVREQLVKLIEQQIKLKSQPNSINERKVKEEDL